MFRCILLVCCVLYAQIGLTKSNKQWQTQQNNADYLFEQRDYAAALKLYTELAEGARASYAQFKVGWIYDVGLGVPKSCTKALRWYTHSANAGYSTAQYNLYIIYLNGCDGVLVSSNQAMYYLERAVKNELPRAMASYSKHLARGDLLNKNYYEAYDLAQKSAEKSDILGITLLAEYYAQGMGVPVDKKKSFELIKQASNMGVDPSSNVLKTEAQLTLAEYFISGLGTPIKLASAYKWLLIVSSSSSENMIKSAQDYINDIKS
ncbi:MAG: hypothetical protein COB89_04015, partial [Piscirickettsiaceae bacterium]